MNFINLLSILESKDNLSNELFKKYLEYLNVTLQDYEQFTVEKSDDASGVWLS